METLFCLGKDEKEPYTKVHYDEDAPEDYYVEDACRRSVRSEAGLGEESSSSTTSEEQNTETPQDPLGSPKRK